MRRFACSRMRTGHAPPFPPPCPIFFSSNSVPTAPILPPSPPQGMVLLAVSAWVPGLTPTPDAYPTPLQNGVLFSSLYIIALGTGGIKPNVSAFGADQFDEADPQDRREKNSFFNWWVGGWVGVGVPCCRWRPAGGSAALACRMHAPLDSMSLCPTYLTHWPPSPCLSPQVLLLRQHRQPAGGDGDCVGAGEHQLGRGVCHPRGGHGHGHCDVCGGQPAVHARSAHREVSSGWVGGWVGGRCVSVCVSV